MWLRAPEQKIISTRLAFGLKCGGRGARGAEGLMAGRMGDLSAPRRRSEESRLARAMPPRPVPAQPRKSRRSSRRRPAWESVAFMLPPNPLPLAGYGRGPLGDFFAQE